MPRSSLFRVLAQIHDRPWAITSRALDFIISIVEREQDVDAVAAKLGRPLDNTGNSVTVRNGVAILGVEGPLFRYANVLTEISGATSVQVLATDFQAALDNPLVKQIVLNVDSPGGEIDGIQELADQIREGSKQKPVTAYVDGLAASAAYWLAAAANRIVASESSLLGSIGVVASISDHRGAQEKQGVKRYEIVSSKSPYKRPDPGTDEGRTQILEMVDALADIFIGRVAALRGVSTETVEQNFGQGKTLVARRAVAAGMADEIGSFEPLVARLAAEPAGRAQFAAKEKPMIRAQEEDMKECPKCGGTGEIDGKKCPECDGTGQVPAASGEEARIAPARVAARSAETDALSERKRISAILTAPEAAGREQLARTLALDTVLSPETARKVLASAPLAAAGTPAADPLADRMAAIKNPAVGTRGPEQEDGPEVEAARILAFVPKGRKRA